MSKSDKYAFLNIYHEAEGVARGAHLVEKINRAMFGAIKAHSTGEHARNNNLFHIETEVPDVVNLDRATRAAVLGRLIQDQVVAQILRLDFDPQNNAVQLQPCFITHQTEDSEQLVLIYQENIQRSVNAVELMLGSMPMHGRSAIRADLELDFDSPEQPGVSQLPATLVEPFAHVHASKFDVLPAPEMIQQTIRDIEGELIRRHKLINLINYGYLYYREQEAVDRIEAAVELLHARIIERYIDKPGLKKQLDAIQLDESSWKVDEHAPPTTRFDVRRVEAVKQAVLAEPGRSASGTRFPGALSVETLIALGDQSETLLQKKHKLDNLASYEGYRKQLLEAGQNWQASLLALSEAERQKMPPESWRNLVDDLELYYRRWETDEGSWHVFIRRQAEAFRVLIKGMAQLPVQSAWQIMAMKTILEENESDMPDLFKDSDLIGAYGQLLRRVYMGYIPWLYRFLMFFGLAFARDAGFRLAKQSIDLEQERLLVANRERADALVRSQEAERQKVREQLKLSGQAREIQDQLDWFYQERSLIPSIGELRNTMRDMDLRTFESVIAEAKFQLIKVPDSSSSNDRIILYPMDGDWSKRLGILHRVADKILQQPDISSANPLQGGRARILRKFLSRSKPQAPAETDHVDPYEQFAQEVDKVKRQEALDSLSEPDQEPEMEF
ncbi:MAG: hypothetical protein KDK39_05910 [Leptospiraceae bacterium]|nr:hypothetical protein [Leptospiraceae bacterium]